MSDLPHLHFIGIGGTFMGQLALMARELGHRVTGCDQALYPPMSTVLEQAGVMVTLGFDVDQLSPQPDLIVVGNVAKRGMPIVEAILEQGLTYVSGPEWLKQNVLPGRHVIAVSGTHGKTTTTAMLVHMLRALGEDPGYLVAGVLQSGWPSSCVGTSKYFIIEADEYDTAFFDKRAKFVHYQPRTLIITSLEYDHADIYPDLAAIQKQFHHVVRMVPEGGAIIRLAPESAIDEVLSMGCYTPTITFGLEGQKWQASHINEMENEFDVVYNNECLGQVKVPFIGRFNILNALCGLAAIHELGLSAKKALQSLSSFQGVKRRCELKFSEGGVDIYDDFAHHPSAISGTLAALKANLSKGRRLLAVLEPRSHTMKKGVHAKALPAALDSADLVYCYQSPEVKWDVAHNAPSNWFVSSQIEGLLKKLYSDVQAGDTLVIMSNGGFESFESRLISLLKEG